VQMITHVIAFYLLMRPLGVGQHRTMLQIQPKQET
jgi:hypothetical protein